MAEMLYVAQQRISELLRTVGKIQKSGKRVPHDLNDNGSYYLPSNRYGLQKCFLTETWYKPPFPEGITKIHWQARIPSTKQCTTMQTFNHHELAMNYVLKTLII